LIFGVEVIVLAFAVVVIAEASQVQLSGPFSSGWRQVFRSPR
jgi:hypothetical protein